VSPARRTLGVGALALAAGALSSALAGPPKSELPEPPAPDKAFYVERIAPWVEEHCARCHRGAGAGTFALTSLEEASERGLDEAARRARDFERVKPFVTREAPWESPLLKKALDPALGGDPHVGGAFLAEDEPEYDALLDFCSGATPTNLPPEVYLDAEIRTKPGEPVVVDGSGSFDRDRKDLLIYRWDVAAAPPGSKVALSDVRASRVEFTPDVGGTYLLRLRVSDGKVWSAARIAAVEAFQSTQAAAAREPGAISGLEQVTSENLVRVRRLYLDVLGRAPTPAEALEDALRPVEGLVSNVLLRAEAGRVWYEEATLRLGLVDDLRPVSREAAELPLTLVSEHLAPYAAEARLVRDPSFLRAHPPGRALAEALARGLLDRAPAPEELVAAERLATGEPADVPGLGTAASSAAWIEALLASEPYQRAAVRRRLARFLPQGSAEKRVGEGLLAARAGGQAWRAFLEKVLLSPEYQDRRRLVRKDDLTLLRGLFVDLLERKPTDRELLALVRALRVVPGAHAPFAALVKVLIDSGAVPIPLLVDIVDAPQWITDRYLRYVGRRPAPEELTACGEVLLDPQGGPELVVYALLTGPEYACR
jgi:hypothetical protein